MLSLYFSFSFLGGVPLNSCVVEGGQGERKFLLLRVEDCGDLATSSQISEPISPILQILDY